MFQAATVDRGDVQTSGPSETVGGTVDTRQVENGHIRIANGVMDDLIEAHLSARQFKVVLAVIRKTYGFNKKLDRISGSQLAKMTGLTRSRASLALNELIAMNIVIREGGQRSRVGYNKDSTTWVKCPKHKPPESPGSTLPSVHNLGTLTEADKVGTLNAECSHSDNTECSQSGTTQKTVQTVKVDADASTSSIAPVGTTDSAAAEAASDATEKEPKRPRAPDCPYDELADLWAKHFPHRPRPKTTLSNSRKKKMRTGWAHAWRLRHRKTNRPLYQHLDDSGNPLSERDGGLIWWDRFMRYIAEHCPFCAVRQRNFDINWLFTPSSIDKIIDGNYEGPLDDGCRRRS